MKGRGEGERGKLLLIDSGGTLPQALKIPPRRTGM